MTRKNTITIINDEKGISNSIAIYNLKNSSKKEIKTSIMLKIIISE